MAADQGSREDQPDDEAIEIYKTAQEKLGTGAYGAVYKATLSELPCAAKILHPILFETNDPAGQRILQRFQQECELLRHVQHPNIVQYLGVTTDPESRLPVLLMELLDESLTNFLERVPAPLPYHTQVNLSHDIALAVAYLHSKGIAHRDLSSNNVLLIAGCKAKVTDFGMSKLVDVGGHVSQHSLTQVPGTEAFMPPEAFFDQPLYSNKIDCFAFGPLFIQLVTGLFPAPGPRFTLMSDVRSPTGTTQMPILEVDRRMNHISLIDPSHPLLPIARHCLEYRPTERPTAREVCRHVARLKKQRQYTESKEQGARLDGDHQRELVSRQNEIIRLRSQLGQEMRQKEILIVRLEQKERELTVYSSEKERRIEELQREVDIKIAELLIKEADLMEKENQNEELQERLEEAEKIITEKDVEIEELSEQLQEKKVEIVEVPQALVQTNSLDKGARKPPSGATQQWIRGDKAPSKMYYGCTAVAGNIVYFKNGRNKQIYQYNTERESWSKVSACPRNNFPIVLIEGVLTAVGGTDANARETNSLLSYVNKDDKWMEKYPAMPTKRFNTTAVANGQYLIVLGGTAESKRPLQTVELMDIPKRQWYRACDLPHLLFNPSVTTCGDSVYLTGWRDHDNQPSTGVLSCSLTKLQQYATPYSLSGWLSKTLTGSRQMPTDQIWIKMANLPVAHSTCSIIKGDHLITIGGENVDTKEYSNAVYEYNTIENTWELISEMPTSRASCLVAMVLTNRLLVVGGFTGIGIFTDIVEIGSF